MTDLAKKTSLSVCLSYTWRFRQNWSTSDSIASRTSSHERQFFSMNTSTTFIFIIQEPGSGLLQVDCGESPVQALSRIRSLWLGSRAFHRTSRLLAGHWKDPDRCRFPGRRPRVHRESVLLFGNRRTMSLNRPLRFPSDSSFLSDVRTGIKIHDGVCGRCPLDDK